MKDDRRSCVLHEPIARSLEFKLTLGTDGLNGNKEMKVRHLRFRLQ